jgi:hypothetical protein
MIRSISSINYPYFLSKVMENSIQRKSWVDQSTSWEITVSVCTNLKHSTAWHRYNWSQQTIRLIYGREYRYSVTLFKLFCFQTDLFRWYSEYILYIDFKLNKSIWLSLNHIKEIYMFLPQMTKCKKQFWRKLRIFLLQLSKTVVSTPIW